MQFWTTSRDVGLLLFVFMSLGFNCNAYAQCNGQDPLNCYCEDTIAYTLNLCVSKFDGSPETYGSATIYVCNQFANPNLIVNPCTNCTEPVDAVTWVNKICVSPELATTPYADLLPAIICAASLCKNPNFLGVVIPACTPPGVDSCQFDNPYCHLLSFPRCVRRSGNCWENCSPGCTNRCIVWRKYCTQPGSGCWVCSLTFTCTYLVPNPDVCPEGCEQLVDCPYAHPLCCN